MTKPNLNYVIWNRITVFQNNLINIDLMMHYGLIKDEEVTELEHSEVGNK